MAKWVKQCHRLVSRWSMNQQQFWSTRQSPGVTQQRRALLGQPAASGDLTTHNTHNTQPSTSQHTTLTTDRPLHNNTQHSQQTELYLTTHNTHKRQTSTSQHTTLTTHSPLPHNTQHSQQTDVYLTTHNTHNRQTSTSQHTTLTTHRHTFPPAGFESTIPASERPQTDTFCNISVHNKRVPEGDVETPEHVAVL